MAGVGSVLAALGGLVSEAKSGGVKEALPKLVARRTELVAIRDRLARHQDGVQEIVGYFNALLPARSFLNRAIPALVDAIDILEKTLGQRRSTPPA